MLNNGAGHETKTSHGEGRRDRLPNLLAYCTTHTRSTLQQPGKDGLRSEDANLSAGLGDWLGVCLRRAWPFRG